MVQFVPDDFTRYYSVVNGIIFQSFSTLFDAGKRNATESYMLFLYSTTWLNLLVLTAFVWNQSFLLYVRYCHLQTEII